MAGCARKGKDERTRAPRTDQNTAERGDPPLTKDFGPVRKHRVAQIVIREPKGIPISATPKPQVWSI